MNDWTTAWAARRRKTPQLDSHRRPRHALRQRPMQARLHPPRPSMFPAAAPAPPGSTRSIPGFRREPQSRDRHAPQWFEGNGLYTTLATGKKLPDASCQARSEGRQSVTVWGGPAGASRTQGRSFPTPQDIKLMD